MQEVAPGLRRRRQVAGVLLVLLVLRYASGQDLRQQLQLHRHDPHFFFIDYPTHIIILHRFPTSALISLCCGNEGQAFQHH